VSAASVSTTRSTGEFSFAGTMSHSGGTTSSCIAVPRLIAVVRTIGGGIGAPTADCGLMPPGAVDADLHLARESAFGDLAVDGRARQAGTGEHRLEADNSFGSGHGGYRQHLVVDDAPCEQTSTVE